MYTKGKGFAERDWKEPKPQKDAKGYTKGEWTHTEDGVIVAEDGKQIASVFPRDRGANAHLIAAAPALYEALKGILPELKEYVQEVGDCDHSVGICFCGLFNKIDNLEQALAKAEVE